MSESGGQRRGFFDVWSRVYDLPPVQAAIYHPVHDAVLGELRAHPARRILDVGCGTGDLTARLRAELTTDLVAGCDFSAGMLEQAAARTRAVRWLQGDATRLPFTDSSFEAVVSTEAFHWFPDPNAARLVANADYPQIQDDYARSFRVLRSLPADVWLGSHTTFYRLAEKYAKLEAGGANPYIDPEGYKMFLDTAERQYQTELERQKQAK